LKIGKSAAVLREDGLAIAGIKKSVLALACFVVFGAYVGISPSRADETVASAPEAAQRQRTPRNVQRDGFPHHEKDHLKVECADCHLGAKEKPVDSDKPMAKDFPHNACINCHNFASEFFKAIDRPSKFCSVCHEPRPISRADKALKKGVLSGDPQSNVRRTEFHDLFGHLQHQGEAYIGKNNSYRVVPVAGTGYGSQFTAGARPLCTSCHVFKQTGDVEQKELSEAEMSTQRSHAACFVCHNGNSAKVRADRNKFPLENDCRGCHELNTLDSDSSGQSHYTMFGKIKAFRHFIDHDMDIRPKRRRDLPLSTVKDFLCVQCHTPVEQTTTLEAVTLPKENFCNECHKPKSPGLPDPLTGDVLSRLGKR
jgi:hypothetical protein